MPFSDLHCALGDSRSFADPVSNWVMISGVEFNRDFAHMMQQGKYPIDYLPEFIHEAIHHTCFESPVGIALALLQLRARRLSILHSLEASTADEYDVLEAAVRYETAISMMRPLAEGMALYGEFDAIPGDSPVMTNVARMAALSFYNLRRDMPVGVAAQELLTEFRITTKTVERKANLLVQPFSTAAGGYLPGYLFCKNLRLALLQRGNCDKFVDTDLYLHYLRCFFYDDYGLVAALLNPESELNPFSESTSDSAQAISIYIQQRFAQFGEYTDDTSISRVEAATLGDPKTYLENVRIGIEDATFIRGRQLLEDTLKSLSSKAETPMEEKLLAYERRVLSQRHLMCVGSFQTTVKVNEHGRVLVGKLPLPNKELDLPVYSGPAVKGAEVASGDGSVEVFMSPRRNLSVFTVSLNDRIVSVGSPGENQQAVDEILSLKLNTSLARSVEEKASFDAILESLLSEAEVGLIRRHYTEQIERVADEIYSDRALLYVPKEQVKQCATAMRDSGLYEILGGDYEFVKAIALLSITNSIHMATGDINGILAFFDTSVEEVKAKIEAIEREAHIKLVTFVSDGEALFCHV